ncbi:GNAT family N-acetyltransferase [Tumebacillus flagellatus]|uniref:N-acetyltransferase domain-containing protein n=1 Tax=Tumebacillus flagellatus TaxID=1157490 RepID=A0A074LMS5_9BACL|nr:GNAT family N-acetyltransferase [Tumebacillus flagellatus]KEO81825.1 hypothetical protein EL26_18460 [Tumebacillus flagellatus]
MPSLILRKKYAHETALRERLYPLFQTVFGIDAALLREYHSRGFWNPTYSPYTLFDGNLAVANASKFALPLLLDGQAVQAAGIQSVMTHPEYRGHGLMKRVFTELLSDLDRETDLAFLQTDAPELYRPYGFQLLKQHLFTAEISKPAKAGGLRKVDFLQETGLVREMFQENQPVSKRFAPLAYGSSFALNLYDPSWQERLFYAESLRALLVYEVRDGVLRLFDVAGWKLPTWDELLAVIPDAFTRVEFHFAPDAFLDGAVPVQVVPAAYQNLMVRGNFPLASPFKLQPTAAF